MFRALDDRWFDNISFFILFIFLETARKIFPVNLKDMIRPKLRLNDFKFLLLSGNKIRH